MAVKGKMPGKRPGQAIQRPMKKQKLGPSMSSSHTNGKVKLKGKDRASERETIPIPKNSEESDNEHLSDQDMEFFAEHGDARFLQRLDEKGISRSKKETDRLHKFNKPARKTAVAVALPSLDSHDEDTESWSSGIEDDLLTLSGSDAGGDILLSDSGIHAPSTDHQSDSDAEMPYEMLPRKRRKEWESEDENQGIERLPIKLADGRIQKSGMKVIPRGQERVPDDSDAADEESQDKKRKIMEQTTKVEDVSTGARFGRPAVVDVIGNKSRKARIEGAKQQIASICQEIVSDPENSLGLLRRLHTFCLHSISTTAHPEPVINDPLVRKLAFLSQLAVFRDIIPGYRIRPLTDKEKAEKVSQIVQRTRDFEQGLVSVYQSYLRVLEAELKSKSDLAPAALQCVCKLLQDVTHFNFRVNLMSTIVSRLSKKSWDEHSELCLSTLINVFRADNTGASSLEVVRLLNRMIKERRFNVHPNILSCLLHLRLKTELGGVRASESKADKDKSSGLHSKGRAAARRAKGKATNQPHFSKKAQKKRKETQGIEEEMREAEAEVDREERANMQTETLKLLFVLYFRILKNPHPTPLLPAALQGISRYAHLVNIDFFKDLMQVLKDLISRGGKSEGGFDVEDDSDDDDPPANDDSRDMVHRLQCIVTAFELLTGQGEALNIDLNEFINRLYAVILPLSTMSSVEEPAPGTGLHRPAAQGGKAHVDGDSPADMLFRALNLVFTPRASASSSPPWRSAAFAKRLLIATLHFPPATARKALAFVHSLVAKEPKLEALLSSEDRIVDGVYRPDIDDPQLCNAFGTSFFELQLLERGHVEPSIRQLSGRLAKYTRES